MAPSTENSPVIEQKRRMRHEVLAARSRMDPLTRAVKSEAVCRQAASLLGIGHGGGSNGVRPAAKRITDARCREAAPMTACSRQILPNFDAQTILGRGSTIAVYAALPEEVDLSLLIERCYQAGIRVAFPCMNPKGSIPPMCMRAVDRASWRSGAAPFIANPLARFSTDDDVLGAFPVIEPDGIDAVAVPLVAFDDDGGRLGYGGGNYDSFLGAIGPDAAIFGVAFDEQRVERVPLEPHDRPLPFIIHA